MKMTIEQIIKLSDIGFTADEIKQLSGGETVTKPAEPKPADPTGEPKPANPTIETKAFSDTVNALMAEISGLKKTIQATNILNSSAGQEKTETADDILKSFMKGSNK
jgi:hypothetical protein